MNALTAFFSTSTPRPARRPLPMAARPARRERDFGVGYGSSSGYASNRRYAPCAMASGFRFR